MNPIINNNSPIIILGKVLFIDKVFKYIIRSVENVKPKLAVKNNSSCFFNKFVNNFDMINKLNTIPIPNGIKNRMLLKGLANDSIIISYLPIAI